MHTAKEIRGKRGKSEEGLLRRFLNPIEFIQERHDKCSTFAISLFLLSTCFTARWHRNTAHMKESYDNFHNFMEGKHHHSPASSKEWEPGRMMKGKLNNSNGTWELVCAGMRLPWYVCVVEREFKLKPWKMFHRWRDFHRKKNLKFILTRRYRSCLLTISSLAHL